MKHILVFKADRCRECRACELVCSLTHEKECAPSYARLRLRYDVCMDDPEMDVCRNCDRPDCLAACPIEGAMWIHQKTQSVVVDRSRCTACGECVAACPHNDRGNILFIHPRANAAVKCDLCMGNPQCVRVCPDAALSFTPVAQKVLDG